MSPSGGSNMNIQNKPMKQSDGGGNRPQLYKNILATVDLSEEAEVDLNTAIALAKHYDADLWLLGFTSEPAVCTDARGLCNYVWDSWDRRAQVRLWDLILKSREAHYRTFPLFIGGHYDPEEIIRTAKRTMADLIVVPVQKTSHGLGKSEKGQADTLLRKSGIPVFITVPRISPRELDKKQS